MKFLCRRLALLSLIIIGSVTAKAEIYQCKKSGETIYQDAPCDVATQSLVRRISSEGGKIFWDGLNANTSIDALKARMSDAQVVKMSPGPGGMTALRVVGGVVQNGRTFKAEGLFISNKLVKVSLFITKEEENKSSLLLYEQICADLHKKYGKETRSSNKRDDSVLDVMTQWETGGGRVYIFVSSIGRDKSVVVMGFDPA